MIFLETRRLLFRTHEPQDLNDFVAMHTDPEVRRYVGGAAWSVEKAKQRFRDQYLGQPDQTYGLWATIAKETGSFIGSCGLSKPANEPAPKLGYYIARAHWGQGYASEAAKAFLEFGFGELKLAQIVADVEQGHRASERILQKFAFRPIREEKLPAGRVICFYELTKDEWEKRQGGG